MFYILKNLRRLAAPFKLARWGVVVLVAVFLLVSSPPTVSDASTTSSETTILEDFSGSASIYHQGFGNSNKTLITDTNWVLDEVTVSGDSGASSVLDQFVTAGSSETEISRNALFIGSGSIDTNSFYKGSNNPDGEDSVTGILVVGENYGVLIETGGSLLFNSSFGGILDSVASSSGNYEIAQHGGFGNLSSSGFLPGSVSTAVGITGEQTGTLKSFNYGSVSGTSGGFFSANTKGWAAGEAEWTFLAEDEDLPIRHFLRFSSTDGEISVADLFELLEAYAYFAGKHY